MINNIPSLSSFGIGVLNTSSEGLSILNATSSQA